MIGKSGNRFSQKIVLNNKMSDGRRYLPAERATRQSQDQAACLCRVGVAMQGDICLAPAPACGAMDLSGRPAVGLSLRSGIEIERKFND
jgi:hypothetical protein